MFTFRFYGDDARTLCRKGRAHCHIGTFCVFFYSVHERAAYTPLDGGSLGESVQVLAGEALPSGAGGTAAPACRRRFVRGASTRTSEKRHSFAVAQSKDDER